MTEQLSHALRKRLAAIWWLVATVTLGGGVVITLGIRIGSGVDSPMSFFSMFAKSSLLNLPNLGQHAENFSALRMSVVFWGMVFGVGGGVEAEERAAWSELRRDVTESSFFATPASVMAEQDMSAEAAALASVRRDSLTILESSNSIDPAGMDFKS